MDLEALKTKLAPEEFEQLSAMAKDAANAAKTAGELAAAKAELEKARAANGGANNAVKEMQAQLKELQERAKQADAAALQARRENAITGAMTGKNWASAEVAKVFLERHVDVNSGGAFVVKFDDKELPVADGVAAIIAKNPTLLASTSPTGAPSYVPPSGGGKAHDIAVNSIPSWIKSKGKK